MLSSNSYVNKITDKCTIELHKRLEIRTLSVKAAYFWPIVFCLSFFYFILKNTLEGQKEKMYAPEIW